jgi:penicillin V acylase-like amidase (Ntn superfamily)
MCTRVVYLGPDELVITARSMDWFEDMGTDLWAFPRGMERDGAAGSRSVRWVSKYGSVIAAGYDIGTTDGVNEAGLAANMLYLAEADYPKDDGAGPVLCISTWPQYVLDCFGTVAEAVEALAGDPFCLLAPDLPNGKPMSLHLAVSDAGGDSAILEYVGGALKVHHGREYQVMTNSPVYDEQLAINRYWETIGGTTMLPGTNRAADRFARASFYIRAIPQTGDTKDALASVLGVIRNASVPLGISTPGQPNISSTLWRTLADHKSRTYFFDAATSPNAFWAPLADLDLAEGAPALKLPLADGQTYSGNAAGSFAPAEPFAFFPAPAH